MRVLESDQRDVPFHPAALVAARMLRGSTQIDLAVQAGLSRQQLNKLERGGVRTPTAGTVHRLAVALSVPASYLGTAPGELPPVEALHFRSKARKTARIRDEMRVRGEHFRRLVEHLERFVRPKAVNIPTCTASTTDEIEAAADACRTAWGIRSDNPISNVTRWMENAGAFVGLVRVDLDSVEAFSWWAHRPLVIAKRNSDSPSRRRFSLAHELGHLVLHRGVPTGDAHLEHQANRFASAFLLPERAFRAEFPRRNRIDWDGLISMKKRWGVSIQAILHRANDLGEITPSMYRSAYIYISKLGWRRREPAEPDTFETPELVRNIVEKLREHGRNEHALAQDLGFDVELLEDTAGVRLRAKDPPLDPGLPGVIDLLDRRQKPSS